ncbi:MAG TPA: hypothetical protein PLJ89_01195 [Thermoleophilia bacterium]|nr:hypothetical protein [Thermoleophilia bacterium]
MSGVLPISLSRQAILPMVVVLPVPLTPTTRITLGACETSIRCRSGSSGLSCSATTSASSSWNGPRDSILLAVQRRSSSSTILMVPSTPTSAAMSISSVCS